MSNIRSLASILFLALAATAAGAGEKIELYVATSGNDNNPGSKARPFLTLGRARDAVRVKIAAGLKSDLTVFIRGGTYTFRETLVFGLKDSAPKGTNITWASYPGEDPVLSSGVEIKTWKELETTPPTLPAPARGRVWVADMPEGLGRFYSLYDAQGHLPRARGAGFNTEDERCAAYTGADALSTLCFPAGAVRNWPNLDDVEITIRPSIRWTMNILALASVDEQSRIARTSLPGTYPLRNVAKETYKTVWVENVLEALDEPGEWVVDTHARKIYLWPRGDRPEKILAPRLRELIRVEGQVDVPGPTDVPVRGLVFRGLTFAHADRDEWTASDVGIQHDWEMVNKADALLRFRGAEDCVVEQCRFRDSGGNAVRLDLHAQNMRVSENEIHHLGQGGIMLIGYGAGTKNVNRRNRIVNNLIHHSGLLYWHSHAIVLWQSGENEVAHNYIHHMPRKAVCLSGPRGGRFAAPCNKREICGTMRWAEIGGPKTWDESMPYLHTRNNRIEFNEVERVLQKLGDGAAINVSGAGEGNTIRRNFIHDIFSSEFIDGSLRTDDFQRGVVWEENVIYRSNAGGWMHKGTNNLINNFIVDVSPVRYLRTYKEDVSGSVFERNVFYAPNGKATFLSLYSGPEQLSKCRVEGNVYFNGPDAASADSSFLTKLRALGLSATDVYADPMFVDIEHRNFRFKPGSPALKLGIKPVDVSEAGLTRDFPKREAGSLK